MIVTVELPSALARYADGQKSVVVAGDNVRAVFDVLWQQHPQLRGRVLDKQDQLYPYLILFKNNERLGPRELREITLQDGDKLEIMTLAGGG
jgi:molybdopterin converting factor small subunit